MSLFKSNKKRFIIIEDSNLFSYMLSYSIDEMYPSLIEIYASVEEMLQQNSSAPDYILLDHFFSGLKGIDSIQTIKQKYPSAKIIVISAQTDLELAIKAMDIPGCKYLAKKDFSMEALSDLIEK